MQDFKNFLDEAHELIAQKDFLQAKELLIKALELKPDNIDIVKAIGLCNVQLSNFKEAFKNFEYVISNRPEDAVALYYIATLYDKMDAKDNAIEIYKKVIELRENYIDAYKKLSLLYMKTKRYTDAIELLDKALKIMPNDDQMWGLMAAIYYTNGQIQDSIITYKKALELAPQNFNFLNTLGVILLSENKLEDSFYYLNQAIKIAPEDTLTNSNMAHYYQVKQDFASAYNYYLKAYEIEKEENNLFSCALIALKSNQYEKAINHYKELVSLAPEKINYRYQLACCYCETKNYLEAVSILENLVLQNPKSPTINLKLANIYEIIGNFEMAKNLLENSIKKIATNANIYHKLAILYAKTNEIDNAEAMLKKTIGFDENNAQAHKDLAVIYLSRRQFDYAKDEIELAFKLDSNSQNIIFEYANFLNLTADFLTAKRMYKYALTKGEANLEILTYMGINEISLQNLDKAIDCFKKALKFSPSDALVSFHLAKCFYDKHDFENAFKYIQTAYETDKKIETKNLYALISLALKDFDKALEFFNEMIEVYPENVNLLYSKAQCLIELNNFNEAKHILKKVLKNSPKFNEAKILLKKIN